MSSGRPGSRQWRAKNRPPPGGGWVWITREMMEAPAWRAMPWAARQVLDRLLIEHMKHGGTQNGSLVVTYDEFAAYGIRRPSVAMAIRQAKALGWIDVCRGRRCYGAHRRPSTYGLTWLPRDHDFTSITNRWKTIKTPEEAMAMLKKLRPHDKVAEPQKCDFSPGTKTSFSQVRKRTYERVPGPKTPQIPRYENVPTSIYFGGGGAADSVPARRPPSTPLPPAPAATAAVEPSPADAQADPVLPATLAAPELALAPEPWPRAAAGARCVLCGKGGDVFEVELEAGCANPLHSACAAVIAADIEEAAASRRAEARALADPKCARCRPEPFLLASGGVPVATHRLGPIAG